MNHLEALLDRVRMRAADREAAKATLRRAEMIADTVYRTTAVLKSAVEFAKRVARGFAQRVQARLGSPW
jgi:hypothetical protein